MQWRFLLGYVSKLYFLVIFLSNVSQHAFSHRYLLSTTGNSRKLIGDWEHKVHSKPSTISILSSNVPIHHTHRFFNNRKT